MKRKQDFGALLTAFDGKARPPLSRGKQRRIPLAIRLERDEAAERAVAQAGVARGASSAVNAASDTIDGTDASNGDVRSIRL